MLKRRLNIFQWVALFFLGCGTACSQIPEAEAVRHSGVELVREAPQVTGMNELKFPAYVGVLFTLLTAVLSSLAGVYNELLLKGRVTAPLHWQNMQASQHVHANAMSPPRPHPTPPHPLQLAPCGTHRLRAYGTHRAASGCRCIFTACGSTSRS